MALLSAIPPEEGQRQTVALQDQAELAGSAGFRMSTDQKQLVGKVLADLLLPFRKQDTDEAMRYIKARGRRRGAVDVVLQESRHRRDGIWDVWQLESPNMVWYFRGPARSHLGEHPGRNAHARLVEGGRIAPSDDCSARRILRLAVVVGGDVGERTGYRQTPQGPARRGFRRAKQRTSWRSRWNSALRPTSAKRARPWRGFLSNEEGPVRSTALLGGDVRRWPAMRIWHRGSSRPSRWTGLGAFPSLPDHR